MRIFTILFLSIVILSTAGAATAQSDGDAKNLYYGYKPRPGNQTTTTITRTRIETRTTTTSSSNRAGNSRRSSGRSNRAPASTSSNGVSPALTGLPGTKITIELVRGNKSSFVRPNFKFRSGDKIRFRMQTNFEGYITVLNLGSSGNVNWLYPVPGHGNYVTPTADYQIPQGNAWIVFDDRRGTEIVSFIMSENELEGLADLNGNSNYFRQDRTSKDLFIQNSGNDLYAVFRRQDAGKNVGFSLRLIHK